MVSWIHCSTHKEIEWNNNIKQPEGLPFPKPLGIWCSPQTSEQSCQWKEWCESEGVYPAHYTDMFKVSLTKDAKIYTISNCSDFLWLKKTYGTWKKMADFYDGVMIPFSKDYEERLKDADYNNLIGSIDVDSLVLWNPKIFNRIHHSKFVFI